MNVIINIPDGLATELISTAKQNGEDIEAHITKVLSEYIWPTARTESEKLQDELEPIDETASKEEESEEVKSANQMKRSKVEAAKEKSAPLTNDTTTVFGTKTDTEEKGAPLYCKKETNSWKIL